jgi:hypothetical protein
MARTFALPADPSCAISGSDRSHEVVYGGFTKANAGTISVEA